MAGYIMNLDSVDSLRTCFESGTYSTIINLSSRYWRVSHEGTLADYATMKHGDNIYFLFREKYTG